MGLVTNLVAYKLGKSRGKRKERSSQSEAADSRDPDCINYSMFCRQFGSCDGQKCEY